MKNDNETISHLIPDWGRERIVDFWDPGKKLLKSIRRYQFLRSNTVTLRFLRLKLTVLKYRFWSIVSASDIPLNCQIEGGLVITHPNGIVIHPSAKIGPNCLIFQQVTIVSQVKIGGHVDIGAGAKLLKGVTIGNNVKIGANAVVLEDVPDGVTVVGIPANIVKTKK